MIKQNVKIVILFITAVAILVSGWQMYQRLNNDKKAFDSDIYSSIPSLSHQVINVSRNHYFTQLYTYNDEFEFVIQPTLKHLSFPIIISTFENSSPVLLSKINGEQREKLDKVLRTEIAPNHLPKKNKYRGIEVYTYSLPNSQFLSSSIHNGIFAISKDYKSIEHFIDTDSTNSYFSAMQEQDMIDKFRKGSHIGIFQKINQVDFVLDYDINSDTTAILDGYALGKEKDTKIEMDSSLIDQLYLPNAYYIDSCVVNDSSRLSTIKIMLNKIQ